MFFDLWLWILVFIFVVSIMGIWFILSFDCELLFCIYNLINAIIVVTVMGNWCFLSFDCEFRFFCTDFGSFWLFECVRVSVELFFFFYIWGVCGTLFIFIFLIVSVWFILFCVLRRVFFFWWFEVVTPISKVRVECSDF